MNKVFFIKYRLDTGYEWWLADEALVVAENEDSAIKLLKDAIAKMYEHYTDEIFSIEEFKGSVFTKQYGFKPWF